MAESVEARRSHPRPRPAAVHHAPSLGRRLKKNWDFYLFISPFFVLFSVFGLFPILFSFYLSFTDWRGLGPIELKGLQNYANLLTNDAFHEVILNTLILLVAARGSLVLVSLAVAFLFHVLRPRFDHFFRTIYFMPLLVSTVAIAQIFVAMFDQHSGLINFLLSLPTGKEVSIGWLTQEEYAKLVVTLELYWRWFGWNIVFLVASMEAISVDIYDAAQVDGANIWAVFRYIVVPLLKPVLVFVAVTSVIGGFEMFGEVFAIWGTNSGLGTSLGGPSNSAMTTAVYLYQAAFVWGSWGVGAAVSYLMFLMIAAFSYANYRMITRGEAD